MSQRRTIRTEAAPGAIGPYSQAVEAHGLVYTAGQVGTDPASAALEEGVTAQAARALANLEAVLQAAGTGFDRVLKTTIFLADMDDFVAVNEVYARVMPEPYPARSTVAVKTLPRNALVEIEMVALTGGNDAG